MWIVTPDAIVRNIIFSQMLSVTKKVQYRSVAQRRVIDTIFTLSGMALFSL